MKKLFVIIALAALGCVLPAAGDTIHFDGPGTNSQGGVYTAPYYLSINGGADIAAMCVDFHYTTDTDATWDGNLTNLGSGDLSDTRQNNYALYREEAWLYQQYLNGAGPSGDINYAVWALTAADVTSSSGWTAGAQHWFDLATTTDLSSFDTQMVHFTVISPADLSGTSPQEFITVTETPEPGGLLLFGSGMLGAAGLIRKKIRS